MSIRDSRPSGTMTHLLHNGEDVVRVRFRKPPEGVHSVYEKRRCRAKATELFDKKMAEVVVVA